MSKKTVWFPGFNVSLSDAIKIAKYHLDDPDIAMQSKVMAIEKVAEMETHNSITKNDLVGALRWIYEQTFYRFCEVTAMFTVDDGLCFPWEGFVCC